MKTDLHYHDNGVKGPAIVFVHGNSCSGEYFKHQLTSLGLAEKYRMITVDLPGHGGSPHLEDKSGYTLNGLAVALEGFINQLDTDKLVLAGHSLGGHVSIHASPKIKKLVGMMIWGTPPVAVPPKFEEAFTDNPLMGMFYVDTWTEEMKSSLCSINHLTGEKRIAIETSYEKSDPGFRTSFGASIGDLTSFSDEQEILKACKASVALLHGEEDPFIRGSYFDTLNFSCLWRKKVQKIEGVSHYMHLEAPEKFNNVLHSFLSELF